MKNKFAALLLSATFTMAAQTKEKPIIVNTCEELSKVFGYDTPPLNKVVEKISEFGLNTIEDWELRKEDDVYYMVKPNYNTQSRMMEDVKFIRERGMFFDKLITSLGGLALHVEGTPDKIQSYIKSARRAAHQIEASDKYKKIAEKAGITPDVQIIAYTHSNPRALLDPNFSIDGVLDEKAIGKVTSDKIIELYAATLEENGFISKQDILDLYPNTKMIGLKFYGKLEP